MSANAGAVSVSLGRCSAEVKPSQCADLVPALGGKPCLSGDGLNSKLDWANGWLIWQTELAAIAERNDDGAS